MTYLEPTQAAGRAYFARPPEGEITMLNLLRFRQVADYSDSPELAPGRPISGEEAYGLYIEHTLPLLRKAGGDVTLAAEGGEYLIGPAEQRWDRVMLVRHRSAKAFLAFASNQEYLAGMGHRTAALEDSRLLPLTVESAPRSGSSKAGKDGAHDQTSGSPEGEAAGSPEEDLRRIVRSAVGRLAGVTEEEGERRARVGGWSGKEILGHLIDSATNNHPRFVRAGSTEDLVFDGYDQEAWVTAQAYQSRPWPDLLALWEANNLHLASAMAQIPPSVRERMRIRHNLHQIAWCLAPEDQPTSLDYFMRDYVNHLEHHLAQIDALVENPGGSS